MSTPADSATETGSSADTRTQEESDLRNWSSTVRFRPRRFEQPTTLDELADVIADSGDVRVLGTSHSFSTIADTPGTLISTRRLPKVLRIEPDGRVHVSASVTYSDLAVFLSLNGRALRNMGSLPHISVVGAISTGTHGSGDGNQVLASDATSLNVLTAIGRSVRVDQGHRDFAGAVVNLGALGCVTEVTLETVPAYRVRQDPFHGVTWDETVKAFDEIMAAGHSVSVFTDWLNTTVTEVLVKRVIAPNGLAVLPEVLDRRLRTHPRKSRFTQTPTGVAVDWDQALPHFRADMPPSAGGNEIQSEYFVSRADAVPALNAIRRIGPLLAEHLQISELRTIAPDNLWMSGSFERASLAIHFTWRRHPEKVAALIDLVENALAPFSPRPHWGKLASDNALALSATTRPKLKNFAELAERFDPRGAFRNTFVSRVLGTSTDEPDLVTFTRQ
jgi:xylitol oxidase